MAISCQLTTQNEKDTILKKDADFSRYIIQGKWDSLALAYHSEAYIQVPGDRTIQGRDSIKAYWIPRKGFKITHHEIKPKEIEVDGNLAYDIGYYELSGIRQDTVKWGPTKGQYLVVWKKEGEEWKIYADAWSRIQRND